MVNKNSYFIKKRDNYKTGFYNNSNYTNNSENRYQKRSWGIKEEEIEKPRFYNSKKGETLPIVLKVSDIVKIDNINAEILATKMEQIQLVKNMIKENLEKEYGALNINANNYVPKKKLNLI